MIGKEKKVYMGMSGGVDSSVSAALLKRDGYDVTGVFIKVWQPDFIECTWKEDRLDAMRVAAQLGIPFVTLDLEKEYKKGVIDYMIEEYRHGRTPNPDVMCNKEVKFGAFLKWAKEQGADYVATGHYAQIQRAEGREQKAEGPQYILKKSLDENKDQTYFLWTLTSDQLKSVLFPVGGMEKARVRELARAFDLPVSEKKDSQGLCFVGTIDVKTLLKNFIEEKQGNVLNDEGEVIGTHTGVTFYTIGERHGFTITKKSTDDAPYFVVVKDFDSNTLTVSHVPPSDVHGTDIRLQKTNWTTTIKTGDLYDARARYRAPLAKVQIVNDHEVKVVDLPAQAEGKLTAVSGQSLVLYDGDICIGGGIII